MGAQGKGNGMLAEDGRERLTQAGLNLIGQALSIYDQTLRLAVCNRRFGEMFDLPAELVTPGASFEDTIRFLVHRGEYGPVPDPEAAVRARVEQARAFRPHYMERARPDGSVISVEGAPLPQGGWVTVYTDITDIRRHEQLLSARSAELAGQVHAYTEGLAQANRALAATNAALREAQRELTEMEARTRLVTEMMPAHIAHVGPDLRYTFSNRRLASVMPGSLAEPVGRHPRDVLGAETFARIEPRLRQALAGESTVFEITHDGSGRRVRIALTPDRGADGEVQGVYILSTDVTAETQARAALSQTAKRELAAQLTSGLAHDFSNLLTVIMGLQGRIVRTEGLPDETRDLARATLAAARRGGTLLERIARMSGPRELRPVPTDLAAFLADLAAMAGPSLPEAVRLTIDAEPIGAPVLIDAGSVQDALLNLILNARDAIGAGPGTIRLIVRTVQDTWLELAVADDGPGFTPEALVRGLDPFFTTKGGEGSGLGLSMVYDQVRLSGGTLRLDNRPDGGARVTIRLPLRLAASAPAEPTLVLLVEDSSEIRAEVRGMLRRLGHTVLEAASADEARELADLPGIGLILSDIVLPGRMTGVDLAEELSRRGHPARICLMTSLPPGDSLRQRAEAFALLPKPFDVAGLAAVLDTGAAA